MPLALGWLLFLSLYARIVLFFCTSKLFVSQSAGDLLGGECLKKNDEKSDTYNE